MFYHGFLYLCTIIHRYSWSAVYPPMDYDAEAEEQIKNRGKT